jgi:alpha-glucosidase
MRNVAQQQNDSTSMLTLFKALTRLRRHEPALHAGDYATVDVGDAADTVFAYRRDHDAGVTCVVVLNFSSTPHTLDLSRLASEADIALSSSVTRTGKVSLEHLDLAADEGLVLRLG